MLPEGEGAGGDSQDGEQSTLGVVGGGGAGAAGRQLQTVGGGSCASGSVSGTSADAATCEVVGLLLPSNNLAGPIPGGLFSGLPFLRHLNLANNTLSGALPSDADYGSMSVVDLSANELEYPPPNALLAACFTFVACSGYPPVSCDAFGPAFVVKVDDPNKCTECQGAWRSIAALVAVFVLFLAALAGYAWMLHKHQGFTTQGMASASVIMTHLQTMSIVAKLRLAWPPSTEVVMTTFSAGFSLDGTRPECLLAADPEEGEEGTELPFFHIFGITKVTCRQASPPSPPRLLISSPSLLLSLALASSPSPLLPSALQVSVPMGLMLMCGLVRIIIEMMWRRRIYFAATLRGVAQEEGMIDKLEKAETIIFSLIVVSSWRSCFQLIATMNTGSDVSTEVIAKLGGIMAILLLVLELIYITKYAFLRRLTPSLRRLTPSFALSTPSFALSRLLSPSHAFLRLLSGTPSSPGSRFSSRR